MLKQKPSFFIRNIREGSCEGIPTANDFLFHVYAGEYTLSFRTALRNALDGWRYQQDEAILKRIRGLQKDLPHIRIRQANVPLRVFHVEDWSFGCIPIGYYTAKEHLARPILERTLADYEEFFARKLVEKTNINTRSYRADSLDERFSPEEPLTEYVVRGL